MYCRNCGSHVDSIESICPTCGFLPLNGKSFCQECGYETKKEQDICINCNKPLKYATIASKPAQEQTYYQTNHQTYQNNSYQKPYEIDEPNTLANVGACCSLPFTGGLPLVGLILYLVWKDEKPIAAKSVCMWSLVPFIFIAIFYVFMFIIYFIGGITNFYH